MVWNGQTIVSFYFLKLQVELKFDIIMAIIVIMSVYKKYSILS